METYKARTALVTGASSGIGAAVARALLRHGVAVVGLDLQPERMQSWDLEDSTGKLHSIYGDVSNEENIISAFKWIEDHLGGVDILINCAGVCYDTGLIYAPTEHWRRMLDVNVLGLSICTREAVQSMIKRGVDDGFIIHICSTVAQTPAAYPAVAMYRASKVGVKTLLEGLRQDLISKKSNIRVGEISPALVKTELHKNIKSIPEDMWEGPFLKPEEIADAVIYMLSRDPRVQVYGMHIRLTGTNL